MKYSIATRTKTLLGQTKTLYSFARLLLVSTLAALSLHSAWMMTQLAWKGITRPTLYLDSWTYTHHPTFAEWQGFLVWIFNSHAGHRLPIQRVLSIFETEILRVPPETTALLQTLVLLLITSMIIYLSARLIGSKQGALLVWLACNVLLFSPWQSENFWWEFQTPWLAVNMLAVLSMHLFLKRSTSAAEPFIGKSVVWIAIIPWLAIFSSGQGLCLALSLCMTSMFFSRRVALIATASSLVAVLAFLILPSSASKLAGLRFDPQFFIILLRGGSWPALAFLNIALFSTIAFLLIRFSQWHQWSSASSRTIASLLLPAIYGASFVILTTIGRSSQGPDAALASRYISPILMIPISGILALSWLIWESPRPMPKISSFKAEWSELMAPFLSLMAIVLSIPLLGIQGYNQAWQAAITRKDEIEQGFRCSAKQAREIIVKAPTGSLTKNCKLVDPVSGEAIKYLTGKKPLQPLGWHRKLMEGRD